jgi:hypothetical protein
MFVLILQESFAMALANKLLIFAKIELMYIGSKMPNLPHKSQL